MTLVSRSVIPYYHRNANGLTRVSQINGPLLFKHYFVANYDRPTIFYAEFRRILLSRPNETRQKLQYFQHDREFCLFLQAHFVYLGIFQAFYLHYICTSLAFTCQLLDIFLALSWHSLGNFQAIFQAIFGTILRYPDILISAY